MEINIEDLAHEVAQDLAKRLHYRDEFRWQLEGELRVSLAKHIPELTTKETL